MSNHVDSPVAAGSIELRTTPLHELHRELGARLVPFAGWEMPIQYEGILTEHRWCRSSAGLFDVSHMAVIELRGEDPARSLERLTPAGVTTLDIGRQRYGLLTNDGGGVIDDFMVTNWGDHLILVANASRRDVDLAHLRAGLDDVDVTERTDLALLALQGPQAAAIVVGYERSLASATYMDNRRITIAGIEIVAARSGYTGEDGFELMVPADRVETLARLLLDDPRVRPVGLGARDTLRLEAGLSLYGNDLDETISPVEAGLAWTIPKRRREAGDYPGAARIGAELADGPRRIRVGLRPDGRRPVREGAALTVDGRRCGTVSSGGFGPTVDGPVALAHVEPPLAEPGTPVVADVRGKDVTCAIARLPFVPHRYQRGA